MENIVLIAELSDEVQTAPDKLRNDFNNARPFRHLILPSFFENVLLGDLIREFPAFEKTDCRNENGELGRKGVYPDIARLGGAYKRLDRVIQSTAFLNWLSACTGIEELLYDPFYFGGGTHENRSGQDLDLHVDFNFHPLTNWHRRLNLIVYLNEDWDPEWGGNLVLREDPRDLHSTSVTVTPRKNRCVVFETTESSWHGFERIQGPLEDTGRKSIALYFYTRQRPPEETARAHSTVYIDAPLPEHLQPGYTLGEADIRDLQILLKRRDDHLDRIYGENQRLQALLDAGRNRLWGSRTVSLLRWCRYKYLLWKFK